MTDEIAVTPPSGQVTIEFSSPWYLAALVVTPYAEYWPMLLRAPPGKDVEVTCPLLPTGELGWWHSRVHIDNVDRDRGEGIRVGVIDSGCGPHPDLLHLQFSEAIVLGNRTNDGQDVGSHGTHVCGTLGARPRVGVQRYEGVAPGADLFSIRVFENADSGANQADIALAIDALSDEREVDLINLSLGAGLSSDILHDAIQSALDRGSLCVCAAGNEAPLDPRVRFPAAFPECLAVSALGLDSWGPLGSVSASRLPALPELFGDAGLFFANFSCYGDTIAAAAPGVGVIAPVPSKDGVGVSLAAMDGTSMASPVACGALAARLSKDAAYRGLARDRLRAEKARQIFLLATKDVGLHFRYQGHGICQVA